MCYLFLTGRIVTTIFEHLESIDERIKNELAVLLDEVVDIGEDPAAGQMCKLISMFRIRDEWG